jgi:hypothetical protein
LSTKKDIALLPSEWVSPAEAARIRGVARQAIMKLMKLGRIETTEIAGKKLVRLSALKEFKPNSPGRKRKPQTK